MASHQRKRFQRGDGCPQCHAKWYREDPRTGRRYCDEGHELEGWVQYDPTDEDALADMGQITKKTKEETPKEEAQLAKRLTGSQARTLYIECFQIMLRKTVRWMIDEKGHLERLEQVVKDLWDLRLRGCPRDEDEEQVGTELHSSQMDTMEEEESEWAYKDQSWSPEKWPAPALNEILGLCYLACVLLRIPTTIGEIMRWVNRGQMPLKRMVNDLPKVAHDRLPQLRILAMKRLVNIGVEPDKLHLKVMDMALAYDFNYGMRFPQLNYLPMLVDYAKNLGLPIELVQMVRAMIREVSIEFSFPDRSPRIRIISQPEICLVATIVVAVKQFLPFPVNSELPPLPMKTYFPRMNWSKWNVLMASSPPAKQPTGTIPFSGIDGQKLANADDATLDDFFSRMIHTDERSAEDPLHAFFPEDLPRPPPTDDELQEGHPKETAEEGLPNKLRRVQVEAVSFPTAQEIEETAPGPRQHPAWRTPEELPAIAKPFYQLAANQAGLSLDMLVRAADMFEMSLVNWHKKDRAAQNKTQR